MKLINLLYMLVLVALFSCETDERRPISHLSVKLHCSSFKGETDREIRGVEEGYKTVFKGGEQIGITALKDGVIYHGMDNVPFTYDAATDTWKPTNNTPPQLYYYPGLTYIAYYPYDAAMSGKKSEQEIIDAFTPQTDQSTYAAYTASDLMTGEATVVITDGLPVLNFQFIHRMTMIEIIAEGKRYVTAGGYEYAVTIDKFSLKQNETDAIQPYKTGGGMYRYLLSPAKPSPTKMEVSFESSMNSPVSSEIDCTTLNGGEYKSFHFTSGGKLPTLRNVEVGDFFYLDGTFYPGIATNPPKEDCIGVVMSLTDVTQEDPLLKAQNSPFTHGMIVSIYECRNLQWASRDALINSWTNSTDRGDKQVNIADQGLRQGYSNTLALKDYCTFQGVYIYVLPMETFYEFEKKYPAPDNTTHWYWTSIKELYDVYYGRVNLNAQFAKVDGLLLNSYSKRYISTTEPTDYQNMNFDFNDSRSWALSKKNTNCVMRPMLAF